AEAHDDDLAGLENRADAHRQGLLGHVVFAEETAGGVTTGNGVKSNQTRPAMAGRARLIETDVAGAADTQDLQIDAAGSTNLLLISRTTVIDVSWADRAGGGLEVLRSDVDVVQKRLAHPP